MNGMTYILELSFDDSSGASVIQPTSPSFNILVTCAVTSLTIISKALDTTYTLNQGSVITAAFTVVQATACNYPLNYTFTFTKNGLSIPKPAWLIWNNVTLNFSMSIVAEEDVGIYVITSRATLT
jgi:hypothetical protein